MTAGSQSVCNVLCSIVDSENSRIALQKHHLRRASFLLLKRLHEILVQWLQIRC